jgi:uracil-DNA glycosylase family protein
MSALQDLEGLRAEAATCTRCPLYQRATQTVFGEGPVPARLMMVGEQPGDQEDRRGTPFVGPAGRILDEAMTAAGIERSAVYVTNAVKHFKWEPKGKARIHKKPDRAEVSACHVWLDRELAVVAPELVVLLGATAAQALLGPSFRVTRERGRVLAREGLPPLLATIHPSAVLRAPDRDAQLAGLVADLQEAARVLGASV